MEKRILLIVFIFIQSCIFYSCTNFNNDLGNNLYLWGDNNKYYQMVFCDDVNILGDLKGCTKIIPKDGEIGDFSEYINNYAKNDEWIILETNYIKYGKQNYDINLPIDTIFKRYWIVDKGFNSKVTTSKTIIDSKLIGPLNYVEFSNLLKVKNIKLHLKKAD